MALKRYEEKGNKFIVRYSATKAGIIELTGWLDPKVTPPTRNGWYNTKTPEGLEHGDRHYWEDGEFWEFGQVAGGILKVRRSVAVNAYQGLQEKCQ
jgi:hypothetical protein